MEFIQFVITMAFSGVLLWSIAYIFYMYLVNRLWRRWTCERCNFEAYIRRGTIYENGTLYHNCEGISPHKEINVSND